MNVRDLSELCY